MKKRRSEKGQNKEEKTSDGHSAEEEDQKAKK